MENTMFDRKLMYGIIAAGAVAVGALSGAVGASGAQAGLSIRPDTSCTSPSPCVTDSNSGKGPGLASNSTLGTGLTGTTKLASTSTNSAAGVSGTDASTGGTFDAGVLGT